MMDLVKGMFAAIGFDNAPPQNLAELIPQLFVFLMAVVIVSVILGFFLGLAKHVFTGRFL